MSLKNKIFHGVLWVSLSTFLLKIINFTISVVLARLLEPSDFGLIAIGLIIVNFFEMFRDLGVGAALIHRKENMDQATNTAFFILPMVAIVFYVFSYLIAPIASDFFMEEKVDILIKVLSLTFVIWSFGSLPRVLLAKDLEFKKMVIPNTLPKLCYGCVAIGMALQGFGIWSLVAGRLILEITSVISFWYVSDWRPSYKFDKKIAFELISYGKHVMVANIIIFFISVIDITFIGRIFGSEKLGYYSIALSIAGLFTIQISSMLSEVMFPTYSIIQGDKGALGRAYITTLKCLSLVIIPASFGLITVAWYFIEVVYGDKWLPAVAALQVLCIYGLTRGLLVTTENLYLAAGKPKVRTKINLLQLILMSILIYPLTLKYGILGTSIAVAVPSALMLVLTFNEAGKIIDKSPLFIAKTFLPSATGSIIMVSLIVILQKLIYYLPPVLILSFSIALGAVSYIIFLWLTQKEDLDEMKRLIVV